MKTLIRNALIVTMNENDDIVEKGTIAIDGNRITYVGPAEWTPAGPFDRTIEADRLIAMPGMINAHCHSPANLVRGMMPSKPLEIWRAYYRASLARHARRGFLCERAAWRHGDAQERRDDRARSFLRQSGLPLYGRRRGHPSDA